MKAEQEVVQNLSFISLVKSIQEALQWTFEVLAGLLPLQRPHSLSFLLIEGDAGELWELRWNGEPRMRDI